MDWEETNEEVDRLIKHIRHIQSDIQELMEIKEELEKKPKDTFKVEEESKMSLFILLIASLIIISAFSIIFSTLLSS